MAPAAPISTGNGTIWLPNQMFDIAARSGKKIGAVA
jgi:hypothetical protein